MYLLPAEPQGDLAVLSVLHRLELRFTRRLDRAHQLCARGPQQEGEQAEIPEVRLGGVWCSQATVDYGKDTKCGLGSNPPNCGGFCLSETLELFSIGGTIRSLKARKNLQLINKLMSLSQTAFQFLAASFCS